MSYIPSIIQRLPFDDIFPAMPNELIIPGVFTTIQKIGEGSDGNIWLVERNGIRNIKKVFIDEKRYETEKYFLKNLMDNKFVINFLEKGDDPMSITCH